MQLSDLDLNNQLYRNPSSDILDTVNLGSEVVSESISSDNVSSGSTSGEMIMENGLMQSGNFVTSVSGWRILANGSVEFGSGYFRGDITGASGTFTGTITATTGSIGGFNIGTDYIRDVANSFGLASTVSGSDDVRFWAGDTFTNRATAPFRVTEAGAVTASSMTITGGSVTGTPISGIPNNSSTDISLLEKSHNITFSVTDADTVAWSSGTIALSNGRTFSISSGNTGNMSALTYIYLDPAVSSTVLQVTTTYSTAIGANKVLLGTALNNTVTASFIPYGPGQPLIDGSNIGALSIVAGNIAALTITASQIAANTITAAKIVANTITASQIAAGTITATEIAASTITAGKLSISTLSAITADLGSITAGNITLNTSGYIKGGQTAYDTGTGFFLGYDTSAYKFSVGNSAGNKLTWNGSTLTITGSITATSGAIGGWTINSTSIYTGTEDHSGYTANAGDMTLYSNGTDASIHANKFYIDSAGVLNCTAAVISGAITASAGSVIDGTYLSGASVTASKAVLALVNWTQTCTFSVTDADTVAWSSGTLTLADGTAYSISSGNTGNMATKTYIYLDVDVSITAYQITTTAATAVGDNKILLAIAQNGTTEATFMLLNNNSYNIDAANIVAGSITANEIAASAITANKIAANTITANELTTGAFVTTTANITDAIITSAKISDLSVAKLTAGTISSKAITLAITAGTGDTYIAAGKTDFDNTQSGFILGLDDSDSDRAKFYIGNSTEYLNWDGVNLTVTGTSLINAPATKTFTAGEALTANDAVIIAPTATETYQITQTTTDNTRRLDVTTDKVGQTFTTRKYDTQKILSFIFSMSKTGSPGNITFDLHATSGGLPTGAALSSVTLTSASFSGSLADITIDFSPDVSLSSNTMYAVVFYGVSLTGANYYSFADNFASVYADGTAVWYNGSIWQTTNGRGGTEEYFKVNMSEVPTTTGSVYKAEADSPYTYYYNNFIGFAQATVAAAGTARIISSGIMGGFTGLTPGAIYYLSNTAGAISSSAGTNSVKIGRAVSTTELLIVIPPL